MRIGVLGKRRFAFNLKWKEVAEGSAAELVREGLDASGRGIYSQVTSEDGRQVVGYADYASTPEAAKGSIYSYAAALAASGQPGIYVAPVDSEHVWYTVILDGAVVADTDQSLPFDSAIAAVESLRDGFALPVYVAHEATLPIEGANTFDAELIVEGVKVKAMKRIGGGNSLAGALVLAAVVGGIAFGGYWMFIKPDKNAGKSPEEIAAEIRANYLSAMRAELQAKPTDAGWVVAAHEQALRAFPVAQSGWLLDGVSCTPGRCVANYSVGANEPRAVQPMFDQFPAGAVSVLPDQRSLAITLPIAPVAPVAWSDEQILSPTAWPRRAEDTAGTLRLYLLEAVVDGAPATTSLTGKHTPPPEARPVMEDKIAVKEADVLEPARLRGLATHFYRDGFVATSIAFSNGIGRTPAAWRIEFTRTGGQRP